MAALVTSKTQADALSNNTMTSAAVAGGDLGFGQVSGNGGNGIDAANACQFLETAGQTTTNGDHLTAHVTFAASATYDISADDQSFFVHFRQQNLQFNTYANTSDSLWLILFSGGGTTNYARWEMNIQNIIDGSWYVLSMNGTPDTTGGTFDDTDVTGFGVGVETTETGTNFGVGLLVDQLVHIDDAVVFEDTGGAATLAWTNYYDEVKADSGNTYHSNLNLQIKPVYSFYHPVLVRTDDLSDSDFTFVFPPNDATNGFSVPTTGYYSIEFNPDSATATQTLTDGFFAFNGGTYDLTINSATLTSGTMGFTRLSFLNTRNVTIGGNSQATLELTIPSATGTVDVSDVGGTLTITNTSSAIQWTADFAANATLETDSDIDITFAETDLSDITLTLSAALTISVDPTTGSGTYDLSGISTSSTLKLWNKDTANATTITVPSGITTQKIDLWFNYDNEASGPFSEGETLTFGNGATATLRTLVDNGTTGIMYCTYVSGTTPPDNNSITGGTSSATANVDEASGANKSTLTISQPVVSFTVNTNVSALIQIYTNNTQTVLDSTTGTQLVFNHSGQTIDYTIQAAGYIPQRFTAETLSGTTSVTINLVDDPVYNSSHALTFTTDYSYNASTRVMTIVANQEGRDLYSALIDDFQTETALRNCPFPLKAIGPDRIDFNAVGYYNSGTTVGATIDSGDITFWKGAGMQWEHDTTGNPTKKFYSIKSSNNLVASSVVGYTQVVTGTPVEATLVSNQVNQVIQFFEDTNGDGTPDYNYTGHLLFKGFLTGYYQARWDVINDGGVATLEPYEYNISLTQDAISGATGDQTITITTLTDHTGAPLSVGGKSFDYELVDPGTNDADNLLSQVNYDVYNAVNTSISGTLYTSYQAFDLPDLIVEAGSNYETEYGNFEGDGAVADLSGVYLSRSSADHPGITRFQSNDGTYYTPAVTANATGTNLPDDVGGNTRLQILNLTAATASAWQASTAYSAGDLVLRSTGAGTESTAGLFFRCTSAGTSGGSEPTWVITTAGVFGTSGSETTDNTVTWECFALLLYDADPASTGWSDTYTNLFEFAGGETARITFAHLDGATSFELGQTTAAVTTTGFSFDGSLFVSADSVYATNALDGSDTSITNKFSPDYSNNEIDLDTNSDYKAIEAYAYYCYELTTTNGMYTVWGAVTAIDIANYRNNASVFSIFFDETAGFVKQTDSARWFRDDDTRPARDPTTGGNGIEINWRSPAYAVATGSGVTQQDKDDIIDGVHDKVTENGEKFIETTRLIRSAVAGESTVSGTTYTFRDAADSKARITATVDTNGQRTSVTTDSS